MARPQLIADPEVDAQVAEASDLFLANRLIEALAALDETFARSGKASLLAGLIHLYRARIDYDEAKRHLERAGALGIAHAYAISGNLTYDEGCALCPAQAIAFYRRALELADDPAARFGIAFALEEQGNRTESLQRFEERASLRAPVSSGAVTHPIGRRACIRRLRSTSAARRTAVSASMAPSTRSGRKWRWKAVTMQAVASSSIPVCGQS
jgi:tetratricopeptide (TPR) repeat protein